MNQLVSNKESNELVERSPSNDAERVGAFEAPLKPQASRRSWWRYLAVVFSSIAGMFDGGRMWREVGPGMKPLERYEFEKPQYRDQFRGGNF